MTKRIKNVTTGTSVTFSDNVTIVLHADMKYFADEFITIAFPDKNTLQSQVNNWLKRSFFEARGKLSLGWIWSESDATRWRHVFDKIKDQQALCDSINDQPDLFVTFILDDLQKLSIACGK